MHFVQCKDLLCPLLFLFLNLSFHLFYFFPLCFLSNTEMFLLPLTEGLNSGFCGFYCLCQTYSQTWFSVSIPQILFSSVALPPLLFCIPTPHSSLTLLEKKKITSCVVARLFPERINRSYSVS